MTDMERATTGGLTRRRLVKTGAHAAWAVPTIVLVTAAPSFADSGNLSVTTVVTTDNQDGRNLDVNGTISNADTSATNTLRLIVTIVPGPSNVNVSQSTALVVPNGFTLTSSQSVPNTTNGTGNAFQFVFTADNQLAGGATINYSTVLAPRPDGKNVFSGMITVVADPGGAGTSGQASAGF